MILINDFTISNSNRITLIAGPCVMEGYDHTMMMAENIKEICYKNSINVIYKSSFDKANRTSIHSERGIGIDETLKIFEKVKNNFNLPILTDVHLPEQCCPVSSVVDVLQIPAFLCRQTDLLVAAGMTKKVINVKKGQFLAPWDMANVVDKIKSTGNDQILLCERGTSFGYNTLISDMRSLPIMKEIGYPVIFDATHSVQQPGGNGTSSGGQRQFVQTLATAATAVGVAGIFMEVHQDPDNAPSDGPNMIPLDQLDDILKKIIAIDDVVKSSC
ncbi:MAG: 3-deoxy-8-phosphooctulonate synthase [Candidimonas sp.]